MKTAEVRDKIKEIIKSNKWTYISENQKIDAILESYAKQHATEFLKWFNEQTIPEDRIIEWHEWYTEFLNHKQ